MFRSKKQAEHFLFPSQFDKLKLMESEFKPAFLKKNIEAEGISSFSFAKPKNFSFLPGQYVDVTLFVNGRDETYSFTLSSTPKENELVFTTRQSGTPYKKTLFSLQKGQVVAMRGPLGGFVLTDEDTINLVFLAGGIGITPFRSMIVDLMASPRKYTIYLLASFSKKEEIIFHTEFEEIMKHNKNMHIVYTLSNEDEQWMEEKGRITRELIKKYIPNLTDCYFFIAGGNDMVDDTFFLLQEMGVENKRIKTDTFTGY